MEDDPGLLAATKLGITRQPPYFFAIKQHRPEIFELFEVQTYSEKIISISRFNVTSKSLTYVNKDVFKRRSDFNGAPIRLSMTNQEYLFSVDPKGEFKGTVRLEDFR